MKVELIDLKEFFDDKYRHVNGMGIGATGIITTNQMVNRFNEPDIDKNTNQVVNGAKSHSEEQIAITRDIYDFEDVLGPGKFDLDTTLEKMNPDFKRMLEENVQIRYINSSSGNAVVIFIPTNSDYISSSQLEAIKFIGKEIEEVAPQLSKPVQVIAGSLSTGEQVESINCISEEMLSFLENYIDDSYVPYMEDVNLLAERDIKVSELVH